jgi:pilus assembly protein CpaE
MGIENTIPDNAMQSPSADGAKVLVLLRQSTSREDFIELVKSLKGIDMKVFYRPDVLNAAMLRKGTRPQVLLLDVDLSDEADLKLIGELRKAELPVVALADRSTELAALKAIRAGADDVLLKPIDPLEAQEVLSRVTADHGAFGAARPGTCLVFMHLTGGAGATTLAVNTACLLASGAKKDSVAILDLDIQFGNAANLLDLPANSPIQDIVEDPARLDGEILNGMTARHATGVRVLTAPRMPLPLSVYTPEIAKKLVRTAKATFEYVIVDMPVALESWTDSVLREASVIYLVCLPTVASVHRLSQMLALLRQEDLGDLPIKVVVNRHQGTRLTNDISPNQFSKAVGRSVDHLVPNEYRLINLSHNQGKPAVQLKPNSPFAKALNEMLGKDLGREVSRRKRFWPSFSGDA